MKTINQISRTLGRSLAVLTFAGLMSLPTLVSAQEQVKGAQKLMQRNAIKTVANADAVQAGRQGRQVMPQVQRPLGDHC